MRRSLPPARALLLAITTVLAFSARAETLRVRADHWMPYNGSPDAELPGYAIELARAIFEPNGITVEYATMPWGDALKAAAAGEIEAVIGANRDEAEGLILPQECVGLPRIGLFVRKENPWRYQNVASLFSVKLGVVLDYKYWSALDDYIAKSGEPRVFQLSGEQPLEDALAQLDAGKLDVVAETAAVFSWTMKSAGYPSGSFRTVYLHEGDPVYFAFTPRDGAGKRFAEIFDRGLRDLRRSGQLSRILARYGLGDWEQVAVATKSTGVARAD